MNLALRNEIINERNNRRQNDKYNLNEVSLFFDELSKLLGFRVDSFKQAIEIFSELKNNKETSTPKNQKNNKDMSPVFLLNSKLSAAQTKINSLKCELDRANSVIFKQKNAINQLKFNNNEYKNLIQDEIRDANSCQVNEIHNDQYIFKLETQNKKLKNTVANLQSQIKNLKEQLEVGHNDFDGEGKKLKLKKVGNGNQDAQLDFDNIELLISQNKKLRKKLDFYKQMASDFRSENEKLEHMLKIRTECHWSNSSIKDAFRNIQDILGLDYDASPGDTYSAVSSLVCHLHNCM